MAYWWLQVEGAMRSFCSAALLALLCCVVDALLARVELQQTRQTLSETEAWAYPLELGHLLVEGRGVLLLRRLAGLQLDQLRDVSCACSPWSS